ncbi:MAG TPA: patatin-like phospholipase family protein [Candidatus Binataceae bacterium]|nr:patatin-like phospholipase family protein [Candidatus Binataceae bacterium]
MAETKAEYDIGLPAVSFLDEIDDRARQVLLGELEWFSLQGGKILFKEGDPADALYLVLTGCLGFVRGTPIEKGTLVGQFFAGETVGLMGMLSGKPQPATLVALRDCSLLRIGKEAFEKLIQLHPRALLRLSAQLVDRLERAMEGRPTEPVIPKTLALLALTSDVPIAWLADELAAAVAHAGLKVKVLDSSMSDQIEEAFYAIEIAHDLVIYRGQPQESNWARMCFGRADRIVLVAGAASSALEPSSMAERIAAIPWRMAELVLLQKSDAPPTPAASWLSRLPVHFHSRIRIGNQEDVDRFGRFLTGRAVGLVLSGGGARGYGHIGVVKALREARIPIDLLGGTSMGGIIAAGVALEWDDDELYERIHRAFVASNPLGDYAIPVVAFTRGHRVTRRLRQHFGGNLIEDLSRPYFSVASNLTTGQTAIFNQGALWRALRASIAVPGLLPPWIDAGEVLVDGSVMNSLPTDVMCGLGRGPVIGVDVTRYRSLTAGTTTGWSIQRFLSGQDYEGPGIISLLLRAATVGGDAQTRLSRGHAHCFLEPPLQGIELRDWQAFDQAIDAGYRYTIERIDEISAAVKAGRRGG